MKIKSNLKVYELDPLSLSSQFEQEWASLEVRSLEPNVYLSPYFLLPALKHLTPEVTPILFAIYATEHQMNSLVGLAIFLLSPPRRYFPLPHLISYQSLHSYRSGILVDTEYGEPAIQALFKYLKRLHARWDGVKLNDCHITGPQGKLMQSVAATCGITWHELYSYERAVLHPATMDATAFEASFERAGGKDLHRRIKRLKEQGDVSVRVLWGRDVTDETIASFLALEDREWTRHAKTSLFAAGHDGFFRLVCAHLRDQSRVFVYELLLNGEAIASAVNFSSGNIGFAFKIGWNQKFAKASPGIINELWFMRDVAQSCNNLAEIDSGAVAGSFIDKIWPDRTTIATGIFVTTRRGKFLVRTLEMARLAKDRLQSYFKK